MPIFRYFAVTGPALLVLLFVTDAWLDDSGRARFNGAMQESAAYLPRPSAIASTAELRFTRDASAAERVREVFAQFVPNEGRRDGRSAISATVIR